MARSPNSRAAISRAPKPKASAKVTAMEPSRRPKAQNAVPHVAGGVSNRLKGKKLKRADQVRHVADNILIKLRTITTRHVYARESQ